MPSDSGNTEVLIVGGGLAGSAAAILLARAGREVVLVERESQPQHKVCGEFLSAEALAYLKNLGVDAASVGAAGITQVRLAGRSTVTEAALPFPAMSLTRRRLDEELLALAARSGARLLRGHSVEALDRVNGSWQATLANRFISANTAFLATGKHDLRGLPRPAGKQSGLIAFKMYWRLSQQQADELDGHVELLVYRGGYAGLQPVEDGVANLCCLVERSEFQRLGGRWESLLAHMQEQCPHLRQRLRGAEPLLAKPLAISAIPYGFVRASTNGLWCLGDQAAVIPSFTGDGMSIALHSSFVAAEMYLRGDSAERFQPHLHEELSSQVRLATMLSRGMVRARTRALLQTVVRFWPGALRLVASQTRLRQEVRAGSLPGDC